RWFVDLTTKLAMGDMHQVVNINGNTAVSNAALGVNTLAPGGLYALPTNMGHFSRDQFAVIPEIGVNLGYQITNNVRAFVGYNLLYLSSVVRPGDQMNRALNVSQLPPGGLQGAPLP